MNKEITKILLKEGIKPKKEFILIGMIVVTFWMGGRGWKRIQITTDEEGYKKIKKNPKQDYINFGVRSVDYVQFDVYEQDYYVKGDEKILITSNEPIDRIEEGTYTLTQEEEEVLMGDWDIAQVTY